MHENFFKRRFFYEDIFKDIRTYDACDLVDIAFVEKFDFVVAIDLGHDV